MTTTNMSLNEPSVGQTAGPDWATEVNANFTTIDQHDHTSGKGVQLTPSALNINSDLEFNGNAATELKRLTIDSSATGSGTNYSVYQSGGNLYWYNGSGQAVQITNGPNVKTTGGSIDGMSGTDAAVDYGSGIYRFEFDSTKTPFAGAKMSHADINLYKYDGSNGSNAYVILKYTGSSEGSNNLTFPDETGTLLSTATNFAGAISIATSASNGNISLNPNGTGEVVIGNGSASGKITTNSTQDLVLDTNAGTNSGSITITDGADGNIAITPNGTGEVDISKVDIDGGAIDGVTIGTNSVVTDLRVDNLKFDGNTISSTNTDGNITLDPNGTGLVDIQSATAMSLVVDNLRLDGNAITSTNTDGDIDLTPNGTGEVNISKVDIDSGAIDGVTIGTSSVVTDLRVDNIKIDGNTISSTNTDGNITLDPNGTGLVDINSATGLSLAIDNLRLDGNEITSTNTDGNIDISPNGSGTIDLNSNTGIGSDPDNQDVNANNLVVGSGSGSEGMTIYSGSSNSGHIYFSRGTSGGDRYKGQVNYSHSNNDLDFYSNGNNTARLASSGKLRLSDSNSMGYLSALNGFTMSDGALVTIDNANGMLLHIYLSSSGKGALFYATYFSSMISLHNDDTDLITTANAGSKLRIFKTANQHPAYIENRTGSNLGVAFLITSAMSST